MVNTDFIVSIRQLCLSYVVLGSTADVLNGINFFARRGEKVGLIGEAGSGKTTLLKAIAMILPPQAVIQSDSQIVFNGIDTVRNRKAGLHVVRQAVSMIFQDPSAALNPVLKVRTFMKDIIRGGNKVNSRESKHHMLRALEQVAMPSPERVLDSYPIQLSGGMRQRVCIAMALLKEGDLLLADEPTTSLDVTIEKQILELLDAVVSEKNMTMVLVSHALGAVRRITDRVYVMYAGDLVENGETVGIFDQPEHPYTKGLFEATPRITGEGLSDGIAGEIPSYVNPPPGCRFGPRCPNHMRCCDVGKPPFVRLEPGREVACYLYKKSHRQS